VSSPSYSAGHSTPIDPLASYVTNYGEVVRDEASPALLRFVDTSSKVDIISFKHKFTSVPGDQQPTFTFQIYESDKVNGPWLKSTLNIDSNSIFLSNSKPYIKIELTIFSDVEDLSALGLLLYVNVAIHDTTTPVISDSARNILRKFPTWMDIYDDSIEHATPELATPTTIGGKFVNSLVGHYLDDFNTQLDVSNINSFISTADIDIPAWGYISYNIPAASLNFVGDLIKLARASSLENFNSSRSTDYIYYHNLLDSQIMTLKKFDSLTIDGSIYSQEPIMLFNIFDEFGARVGLKRLYLEQNLSFKKRILDAYINPPSVSLDGFKKTLRRELNIWTAYGTTPDSNYQGATPEVLEIRDIESSTPYIADNGVPENRFYDFVKYINEKYPFNLGYANWDQSIWDYAGLDNEGVDYIPNTYDNATPLSDYFQPGVGDFKDLSIEISKPDSATMSFDGYFRAEGFRTESLTDYYMPIEIAYNYKAQYTELVPDLGLSENVSLVYEISLPAHNQYSTPSTFYANLNGNDRSDFVVRNYFGQNDQASPEYNYISIVDSNGLTNQNIIFKEKTYNYEYENSLATPRTSSIDVRKASSVKIINGVQWNPNTNQYTPIDSFATPGYTGSYRVTFNNSNVSIKNPLVNSSIILSTPNINYVNSNFKIGSTVYGSTPVIKYSNVVEDSIIINKDNDPELTQDETIFVSELTKNLLIPTSGTPNRLIVENVKIDSKPVFTVEEIYREPGQPYTSLDFSPSYGGKSYFPMLDTKYFVPSSPNIILNSYSQSELTTPIYSNYFESATFSYSALPYVLGITNNLQSTPNYPFKSPVWIPTEEDELRTTPMIRGYVDYLGNIYKREEVAQESNSPFDKNKRDTFLDAYALTRKDFGLNKDSNNQYYITEIKPISLNDKVILEASQETVLREDSALFQYKQDSSKVIKEIYDASNKEFYFSPIDINVNLDKGYKNTFSNSISSNPISMNTGWLNLADEQNYVYAKPIVDVYNGSFFSVDLSKTPTQGAPVLVSVKDGDMDFVLEEMAFSDTATPGKVVFSNEETLICSEHGALYISHLGVKDIIIKDNYTGKVLTKSPLNPELYIWSIGTDYSTPGIIPLYLDGEFYISSSDYLMSGEDKYSYRVNKIEVYDNVATSGSILVPGREYTINYSLAQAFYVDRNVYSETKDEYYSKIYFSATPSAATGSYEIIYESAIQENSTPLGLFLSGAEVPVEEGYVYLSKDEYDFSTAVVEISPQQISKNIDDIIYLTITSYDSAGNFKPYQTFQLSSDLLDLQDEYLTTNKYGLAKTRIRFTGVPTAALYASILITGVSYPQANAHTNSESGAFITGANIEFIDNYNSEYEFKASSSKLIIESDGISENYIYGYIKSNNNPPSSTPIIYWRKARTLYDVLNTVDYSTSSVSPGRNYISGYTHASPDGKFSVGPFYSQPRNNPGYWFVSLETDMAGVASATPNTLYGDVAYWYERFDNIQYLDEQTVLPSYYINTSDDEDIIATPNFTFNLITQDFGATPSAELNWLPPRWLPVDYYDQYQMGLFGSTPNVIATPNYIVGYEES
jgi:hypothetical protein